MTVARLGYEIDSSGAVVAADNLDDMAAAAKRAEVGSKRLTGGAGAVGKSLGGVTFNARMLVPQLSQIGQQFTATGQLGQAVAVQAADIGLAFGVVGTVIGTVAGVALPSLIDAFTNAGTSASDLEVRLDDLSTILGDVKDLTDILELSVAEITEEYGAAANRVRNFAIAQAELTQAQTLSRLADQFAVLTGELDRYTVSLDEISGPGAMASVELQRNALAAIEKDFRVTADQALVLRDSLEDLAAARTMEDQQIALQGVFDELEAIGVPLSNIPEELRLAIDEMITLGRNTDAVTAAMNNLAEASQFRIGLNPNMPLSFPLPPCQRDRGSRGGGRADPFERDLEKLRESLRTEQEVVNEWYSEQQTLLNDRRAMEILGLEGHNQAKLRLEQEYQERLAGIQDQSAGKTLDVYSGLFGSMASLAKAGGEKTFKVWKAFSIAQATIDSYRAYTQVLADPFFIGRPFLRAIAAGSVLASGLAQVASISSTSLGGGGAGSATSASTGVTATGSAPQPQQTRAIISLQGGRSRFTVEEINDIIRGIQDESNDGVIIEGVRTA